MAQCQLQDCGDQFVGIDRFHEKRLKPARLVAARSSLRAAAEKSNRRQTSELWFKTPDILQQFITIHFAHHGSFIPTAELQNDLK
jgi:hypothetical protein